MNFVEDLDIKTINVGLSMVFHPLIKSHIIKSYIDFETFIKKMIFDLELNENWVWIGDPYD